MTLVSKFTLTLSMAFITNLVTVNAAEKVKKSSEVVANILEVHDDHLLVETSKGKKGNKKILLDENSEIIYVGFDGQKEEMNKACTIRASVQGDIVKKMYLTPPIEKQFLDPTPEMLKMTMSELFQLADINKNGRICYVELTEKIKAHAPKHGATNFHKKLDLDKSGALNEQEFELAVVNSLWWRMSRKSPEEMFKNADKDNNQILSKEEFEVFRDVKAHLNALFSRADKDKSGGVDFNEAKIHVNELIYPSQQGLEKGAVREL